MQSGSTLIIGVVLNVLLPDPDFTLNIKWRANSNIHYTVQQFGMVRLFIVLKKIIMLTIADFI